MHRTYLHKFFFFVLKLIWKDSKKKKMLKEAQQTNNSNSPSAKSVTFSTQKVEQPIWALSAHRIDFHFTASQNGQSYTLQILWL